MRTTILKRAWRAFGPVHFVPQTRRAIVVVTLWLATANLFAAGIPTGVIVTTLGGGDPNVTPKYLGYREGDTLHQALFHTPSGIALDSTGQYLYVADRDNSAIRYLDLVAGYTTTFPVIHTNLINKPIAVSVDAYDYVYVLNRGNGTNNGSVVTFDGYLYSPTYGDAVVTNAVRLTNAAGMAMDRSGNIYVTVNSNKLIRIAAGTTNQTTVTTNFPAGTSLQGIVVKFNGMIAACDSGRNGIYLINLTNSAVTTNAGFHGSGDFTLNGNNIASSPTAMFNRPMNVTEVGDGSLIVTDYGNHRVKHVLASGMVTNLYGVSSNYWGGSFRGWYDGPVIVPDSPNPPSANVQADLPMGVALSSDGTIIYTTEDGYHLIRKATGIHMPTLPPPPPAAPAGLTATASYGQVSLTWMASSGATNYNVKRYTSAGGPYITIGSTAGTSYTDTNVLDGTTYYYVVSALNPGGESLNSSEVSATPLASPAPTILLVTTNFGQVVLYWSTSAGATGYRVKRSPSSGGPYTFIGSSTNTSYTDLTVANGATYYYVVSALNTGGESTNSLEVKVGPLPLPPVPDPQIGYVDFPATTYPLYTSVFTAVNSAIFNNDTLIVIKGTPFSSTYYTYGNTTNTSDVLNPTTSSASIPSDYIDGLGYLGVLPYVVPQTAPYLTVKAMGAKADGSPNSAVVQSTFQFVTGNPNINGNNAAQFTIGDITLNAHLYYTLDGSDPSSTNPAAIDLGVVAPLTNGIDSTTNVWMVSFPIQTNVMFKVRAFRDPNYQPSAIVTNWFYFTNFVPNIISFGFAAGEASSDFVASPGQTFYAPVTLTPLSGTVIYSLQFNLTVTNLGSVPIVPGSYDFESMLVKPIPGEPDLYETIPPLMYVAYATNPPPASQIVTYDGNQFVNLITTNLVNNLIGVGWVERYAKTNLYDTKAQDLIQYSIAHDDLFVQGGGKILLGGFNFFVPANADPGQTYQIRIGRPSATSDGIGAPGSSVFIFAPANGSLTNGSINAVKNVTMGQRKYIVGNVYNFRWFNAGDFGNTNLQSPDVEQVFQSAVYSLNYPPAGSDLFDAMDSCGATYIDLGHGYLELNSSVTDPNLLNLLFDGNDTTINQIAFGDGVLDVCDVYVTYRRSIEESNIIWFRRFWTNGVRVAEIAPNIFNSTVSKSSAVASKTVQSAMSSASSTLSPTNQPKVIFTAGDIQATAGSTIQIPITASIFGNHPLRVLMLNLSVVPLDGSPALTIPVTFSYNSALGTPWTTDQRGNGNYSAVWLNSGIPGLTGNNVSIGTLTVTIPANATSLSTYAVHFDHVSASPNGLGSFPKQAKTGLITFSSRTNSSYGDGIPDSWRLRYFLTLNNYLSQTNADADGDGVNNLQEYLAGTDPTDPTSCFKNIGTDQGAANQTQDCVINWPSVIGKQYVIQRSPSLSTPVWTSIATNSGNGTIMEFHDPSAGKVRFYRVSVQ